MSQDDRDRLRGRWEREKEEAETDLGLATCKAKKHVRNLHNWLENLSAHEVSAADYPSRDELESVVKDIKDAENRVRDAKQNLASAPKARGGDPASFQTLPQDGRKAA